jgi:hypothetical protein
MKRTIALILTLVLLVVLAACGGGGGDAGTAATDKPASAATEAPAKTAAPTSSGGASAPTTSGATEGEAPDADITVEEYDQIEVGQTYDEVIGIIGSEGNLTSERTNDKGILVQTYQWNGFAPMNRSVTMTFRDGALSAKDPMRNNINDGYTVAVS